MYVHTETCIYEGTGINHATRSKSDKSLHKYGSDIANIAHIASMINLEMPNNSAYLCQKATNCKIYFTSYCVPWANITTRLGIYSTYTKYIAGTHRGYVCICAIYEVTGINQVPRNTVHIKDQCQWGHFLIS